MKFALLGVLLSIGLSPLPAIAVETEATKIVDHDFYNFGDLCFYVSPWSSHTTINYSFQDKDQEKFGIDELLENGRFATTRFLKVTEQKDDLLVRYYGNYFLMSFAHNNKVFSSIYVDEAESQAKYPGLAGQTLSFINQVAQPGKDYLDEQKSKADGIAKKKEGDDANFPDSDTTDQYLKKLQDMPKTWDALESVLYEIQQLYITNLKSKQVFDPDNAKSITDQCHPVESGTQKFNFGEYGLISTPFYDAVEKIVQEMLMKQANWSSLVEVYHRMSSAIFRGETSDAAIMKDMLLFTALQDTSVIRTNRILPWRLFEPLLASIDNSSENPKLHKVVEDYQHRMIDEIHLVEARFPHQYSAQGDLTLAALGWSSCLKYSGKPEDVSYLEARERTLVQENLRFVIRDIVSRIYVLLTSKDKDAPETVMKAMAIAENLGYLYPEAYISARKEMSLPLKGDELQSFLANAAAKQIDVIMGHAEIEDHHINGDRTRQIFMSDLSKISRIYEDRLHAFIAGFPAFKPVKDQVFDPSFMDAKIRRARLDAYLMSSNSQVLTDLIAVDAHRTPDVYRFTMNYSNPANGDVDQISYDVKIVKNEEFSAALVRSAGNYIVNHEPAPFPKRVDFAGKPVEDSIY